MESDTNIVNLETWDSCVIREMIRFIYSGEAQVETEEFGRRLLQASIEFQVPELESLLVEMLGGSLSAGTCVRMLRFAGVENDIPSLVRRSLRAVRELEEVQQEDDAKNE